VSAANTDKVETTAVSGEDYWDVSSFNENISDFEYEVFGTYEDQVKITRYNGWGRRVIIPSVIDEKPVTRIESNAFKNLYIEMVLVPSSVTTIASKAFYGCSDLTNAFIPGSVTYMGSDVFAGCGDSLKIVVQPSSRAWNYAKTNGHTYKEKNSYFFKKLSENELEIVAFIGEPEAPARSLYIPSDLDGKAFTKIAPYAFAYNQRIKSVDIPNGVESIGNYAFGGCSKIESIVVPASVTTIEGQPFYGCSSNLRLFVKDPSKAYDWANSNRINNVVDNTESSSYNDFRFSDPDEYGNVKVTGYRGNGGDVVIPSRYESYVVDGIADGAFLYCDNITSVTVPRGVFSIGVYAFGCCKNLTRVNLPESLGTIGQFAFTLCTSLTSITLPDAVTSIGDNAFYNCTALESVTLPDNNLTAIGNEVFSSCTKLRSISIPDTVETIGKKAFMGCVSLASVKLSSNITKIEYAAFAYCRNIKHVDFPYSLKYLEESAFDNCQSLSGDIVLHANVSRIGKDAFFNCSKLTAVYILNRDVAMYQGRGLFENHSANFKIYGYALSQAQDYAERHGITFITVNENDYAPTSNYYYKTGSYVVRTYVSTFEKAWEKVQENGGVVGIRTDTKVSKMLIVPYQKSITLELNGHKLDRGLINANKSASNGSVLSVRQGAKLDVYGGTVATPNPHNKLTVSAWEPCPGVTCPNTGKFTIENRGVITGGFTSGNGGGINVGKNAAVTLHYTAIAGNRAEGDEYAEEEGVEYGFGGGVCLSSAKGKLNLDNSDVMYNYAQKGGGVAAIPTMQEVNADYSYDALKEAAAKEAEESGQPVDIDYSVSVKGDSKGKIGECPSSIRSNSAVIYGGGVYANSEVEFYLDGVELWGNVSNDCGGGMYISKYNYESIIRDCVFRQNCSEKDGGGVYNGSFYTTLTDIVVTKNSSPYNSGGIYNADYTNIGLAGKCDISSLSLGKRQFEGWRRGYIIANLDRNSSSKVYVYLRRNSPDITPSRLLTFPGSGHDYAKFFHCANAKYHCELVEINNDGEPNYNISNADPDRLALYFADGEEPDHNVVEQTSRKGTADGKKTYNGEPVMKGIYTYPRGGGDGDALFYYSDGYFKDSAQKYNDHLATLSVCMANAAMNSSVGSRGDDGNYVFKGKNIRQMMIDMGCKSSDVVLSETFSKKPQKDSIGYCIASKALPNNEKLVIIAVRGGGYEAEWASNVTLGVSGEHAGFANAANQVFSGLTDYLSKKGIDGANSKTKFWIAGFSRAGATSNLTAKRIVDNYDNSGKRTFAYPIEAPKGGVASEKKKGCNYNCIHNVVNYRDIVPWVAMGNMGFIRYGMDHFLPGTDVANEYTEGVPHDNYTEILGTDSYKAQRAKMLVQLERLNPDTVYNDSFSTATIAYAKGGLSAATDGVEGINSFLRTSDAKLDMTVEEWIPTFFEHFTKWTFGCEGEEARAKYNQRYILSSTNMAEYLKTNGKNVTSFQESLRTLMDLFMAPSDKGDDFTSALSAFDFMEDLGVMFIFDVYLTYLNDGVISAVVTNPVISRYIGACKEYFSNLEYNPINWFRHPWDTAKGTWRAVKGFFKSIFCGGEGPEKKSFEDIYNDVWDCIKGYLKAKGFTDDEIAEYNGTFATALWFFKDYISADYHKNNQDDLGTMLYNVSNLIQNHDTDGEVPTAWIRSYDSYYTDNDAVQASVKYTGKNAPEAPLIEVKSASTGTVTQYADPTSIINVSASDEIRFINPFSDGDYDCDMYFYRYHEPKGTNLKLRTSEYNWHIFNGSIQLKDMSYDDYSAWSNTFPQYVEISVFAQRDELMSNGSSIDVYSKELRPTDELITTFRFNVTRDKILAYTGKYNATKQKNGIIESVVSPNATLKITGSVPGEESYSNRWAFDHWVVYPYNPATNSVDKNNPVSPSNYASFFGSGFSANSETTFVKNCNDESFFFEANYTKLAACVVRVPEGNSSADSSANGGKIRNLTSTQADTSQYNFESKQVAYDTEDPVSIEISAVKPSEAVAQDYTWKFVRWNVYPYNALTGVVDRANPISSDQYDDLLGEDFKPAAKTTTITNLTNASLQLEPVYEASQIKDSSLIAFPKSYNSNNSVYNYAVVSLPYNEDNPSFIKISGVKPCEEADAGIYTFDHWNIYPYDKESGSADKENPVSKKYYSDYFGTSFNYESEKTKVFNFTDDDYLFEPVYNNDVTDGDFTYSIINAKSSMTYDETHEHPKSSYAVVKSYAGSDAKLTIPSTCTNGEHTWPVIGIGVNAFNGNDNLTEVTIPDGFTSIDRYAFESCMNLKKINIPESVEYIGAFALAACHSSLTIYGKCGSYAQEYAFDNEINFIDPSETFQYRIVNDEAVITGFIQPDDFSGRVAIPSALGTYDVTTISANAFKNNTDITEVIIPDTVTSVDRNAFSGCVKFTTLELAANHGLSVSALSALPSTIKDLVVFEKGVTGTTVKANAFKEMTSIKSVRFSPTVAGIGKSAFEGCTGLTSVTLPEDLTNIGVSAFSGCTSLTSITIPNCVDSIDSSAFYYCQSLKTVNLNDRLTSIGSSAFRACVALENISLPDSLTSIDNYAFYACGALKKISLPDNLTSIGPGVFKTCSSLKSVDFPEKLTSIGESAFNDCDALQSISLPGTVKSIGESAFISCSGLRSVDFSKSVESIGEYAFYYCSSLEKVVISNDKISIGADAFSECKDGFTIYGYRGSNSETYANSNNINFVAMDINVAYSTDITYKTTNGEAVITGRTDKDASELIIPPVIRNYPVKRIQGGAFSDCHNITSVYIPASVKTIGTNVFDVRPTGLKVYGYSSSAAAAFENISQGIIFYALDNFTFSQSDNGTCSVTDYTGSDKCLAIPALSPQGVVTGIAADAFKDKSRIKMLGIPNTITSIDSGAFKGCTGLSGITIPDSVTSIGAGAFADCDSNFTIFYNASYAYRYATDNKIKRVDLNTFTFYSTNNVFSSMSDGHSVRVNNGMLGIQSYNGNAATLSIPAYDADGNLIVEIGFNAFGNNSSLRNVIIPDSVTSIGVNTFKGCSSLAGITIPSNVSSIGRGAFMDCSSLTSIVIPSSVTSIGDSVFANCRKLTNVNIPNGVTSISNGMFENCNNISNLTNVRIPDSVTSIGDGAFMGCTGLIRAKIPNSVTHIGQNAFTYCTSLTSVTIPNSVTSISANMFENCTKLTDVTIPDSVTSIGPGAFSGCSSLKKVTIPNSVTSIYLHAFDGCSSLTSVKIPSSVTSIGSNAFLGCSNLQSVTIPGSVTKVSSCAFYGCENLKSVIISDGVTDIDSSAFASCNKLNKIYIPESVTNIYSEAFKGSFSSATTVYGCSGSVAEAYTNNYNEKIVALEGDIRYTDDTDTNDYNVKFVALDGYTFSESVNGTCSITGYTGSDTDLVIPDFCSQGVVTGISAKAFKSNTKIKSVIIPDSVTSIGSGAFKDCTKLRKASIPAAVKTVSDDAFDGCNANLAFYGRNLKYYAIVKNYKFYDLNGFTFSEPVGGKVSVTDYNGSSAKVKIPDWDGKGNFVTSIDEYAFTGNTDITEVIIPDGVESIGTEAFKRCTSLTSVTIPNSVVSIAQKAFYGCSGLTSVTIPDSVTTIDKYAFQGCSSITSVTIPDSVTSISSYAFADCSSLAIVTIPDSVTSIGECAFLSCSSLNEATIPASVTSIKSTAFLDCGEGLTIYGYSGSTAESFANREESNLLTVGTKKLDKEKYKFVDITKYSKYTISEPVDGTVSIINYFGSATELDIVDTNYRGDAVTNIASEAFDSCTSLKSVTIPGSVSDISSFAFCDCSNLEKVTIGDGVKTIGDGAFYDCKRLKDITIPASVESIAETAFEGCTKLKSLTIDGDYQLDERSLVVLKKLGVQNLTITGSSIKNDAFNGYTELKNVNISDTIESIGDNAFKDCSKLSDAAIPASVGSIGSNAFNNSGITHMEIPEGVKTINQGAFRNCSELKTVILPDSVSSIGLNAFKDCTELNDLTIGDSEITVNSKAFDNCSEININTAGEGKGTLITSSGSLFNSESSAAFHISNGSFSEDVSACIDDNKLIGKNLSGGRHTYTVLDPTTEDMTLENDNHKFILPEGKNSVLERMDLVGVQLRNGSVNQKEALRFVTAVRTDLLRGAKDYGYIVTKGSDPTATESALGNNSDCTKMSLNGTYNELAQDDYSSSDLNVGKYKYLTAAVTDVPADGVVGAKFYIQRQDGTFVYSDYNCIAVMAEIKAS
ncbi:MAG: leucine-rich repeat protein, partial [Ruminococcus sp.]|nr:leucine-rich repeat protein [Ruminococcus sp.]